MQDSRIYNYTSLKQRDTKIYSVGGKDIPGGLSVDFLKIVLPSFIVFVLIGCLLSIPFGISFFNFLDKEHFKVGYTLTFMALGIGIGYGLYNIKFAGYRLYEYLFAYLRPKKVYMNDWKHTEFKLTNITINGFIRHIL